MKISKIVDKIGLTSILAMEEIYWDQFPKTMDDQYHNIILYNGVPICVKRITSIDGPWPTPYLNEYHTSKRIYNDYQDLCRMMDEEKRGGEMFDVGSGTIYFWWNPTIRTIWF